MKKAASFFFMFWLSFAYADIVKDLADAGAFYDAYGSASSSTDRSAVRSKIVKLFDRIKSSKDDKAAKAVARFYDYRELD